MNIEGLGIDAIIAAVGAIGIIAVMRYMIQQLKDNQEKIAAKVDEIEKDVAALKATLITRDDVANEYLRKEMFAQYQKHIDEKFESVRNDIQSVREAVTQNNSLLTDIHNRLYKERGCIQ